MVKCGNYTAADSMSQLVSNNYRVLLVMSRFGISLGFGDRSVGEVCEENGVDTATFLAVVSMTLDDEDVTDACLDAVSPAALMQYLQNSHAYFLDFRLPGIRHDLVEVLGEDELSRAVLNYFDEYVGEVRKHMDYEEKTVFPYVRKLLAGQQDGKYNIGVFSKHHDQVEARLKEFKQILIKYYPAQSTNELNSVLFDIFNCEYDLKSHNDVEDRLFIPIIRRIEEKAKKG